MGQRTNGFRTRILGVWNTVVWGTGMDFVYVANVFNLMKANRP